MIKILYIAQLREIFNCDQEQFELTDAINTLADLRNALSNRGLRWVTLLEPKKTLAAVNQQLATNNVTLQSGDEVAFFRPVTGG